MCHGHEGAGHHHHGEAQEGAVTLEKAAALLRFMHTHNVQHAEELHRLAHSLKAEGPSEAAERVGDALACYREGNGHLAAAIGALEAIMLTVL